MDEAVLLQLLQDMSNVKKEITQINVRLKILEEDNRANNHIFSMVQNELRLANEGKKIIKEQEKKAKDNVEFKGFKT